jgi:hypothetical protein
MKLLKSKTLGFCFILSVIGCLLFGSAAQSSAASYVFYAPAGTGTFLDQTGTAWTPDSNRMVLVTDSNLVRGFVNAGFILLSSSEPVANINFLGAHADHTLSASESCAQILSVTNASQAANVIAAPTLGQEYRVLNTSGYAITIKASGGSGVAVANNAVAPIIGNGTDFIAEAVTTSAISGATIDNSVIGGTTPAAATVTAFAFGNLTSVTHDYGAAHADWTLSAAEGRAGDLLATDASAAANAVVPAGFVKVFHVKNTSGYAVTFKYTASTGVAVANNKQALLYGDGAEVQRILADY